MNLYHLALAALLLSATASADLVYVAEIDGSIDLGTYEYVKRSISEAEKNHADAIVFAVNSEGGFIKSTRGVVEEILESDVKTVSFVNKKFSGALSASTYVLLACDVSAADPQSAIGAAQPAPVRNDTVAPMAAYLSDLAYAKGRNTTLAKELVVRNRAVSGSQALSAGLIEHNPDDLADLLDEMGLSEATVRYISPSPMEYVLSLLSHPQVIAMLLMTGFLGAVYVVKREKIQLTLVPAILFAISLWGLLNIQFSPIGLGLIAIGLAMVSLEFFSTRPTVFGMAGALPVAVGIWTLDAEPFFTPSIEITAVATLISAAIVAVSVITANRVGRVIIEKTRRGTSALVGEKCQVVEELRPNGFVNLQGKIRQALSLHGEKIAAGETVEVVAIEGRVIRVGKEGWQNHGHHGHGDDHGGHDEKAHAGHEEHDPHEEDKGHGAKEEHH